MSLTKAQAVELIYQRLKDNFTTVPFELPNEKGNTPASGSWIRFTVFEDDSEQTTLGQIGNRKFKRAGMILINIFTIMNIGVKESNTLADELRAIFEGVSFGGVRCYNAVARDIGDSDQGSWYQVNLEIDYDYDQIK